MIKFWFFVEFRRLVELGLVGLRGKEEEPTAVVGKMAGDGIIHGGDYGDHFYFETLVFMVREYEIAAPPLVHRAARNFRRS
jgi:hypothetical protein